MAPLHRDARLVAVVDDDPGFLSSALELLKLGGWSGVGFESAQGLIEADAWSAFHCIVADVQMGGMSGLELQEWINRHHVDVPLIIVTGGANVPIAVRAMKAGAVDFLEKPFEAEALLKSIANAVEARSSDVEERQQREQLFARYEQLTPREQEVFAAIVSGQINKEIAFTLGISARTVEVHRGRVMQKMKARNSAQLAEMAMSAGLRRTAGGRAASADRVRRLGRG